MISEEEIKTREIVIKKRISTKTYMYNLEIRNVSYHFDDHRNRQWLVQFLQDLGEGKFSHEWLSITKLKRCAEIAGLKIVKSPIDKSYYIEDPSSKDNNTQEIKFDVDMLVI